MVRLVPIPRGVRVGGKKFFLSLKDTTLDPHKRWSQGWSSNEVQGGREGGGLTWDLALVPYQTWIFISTRRSCLKASAWGDTLWEKEICNVLWTCKEKWAHHSPSALWNRLFFFCHKPTLDFLNKDATGIYIGSSKGCYLNAQFY